MKTLLLVAHGSRRQESNDEVRRIASELGRLAGDEYDFVGSAFLELAEPSIPDGIQQCIDMGAGSVEVLPYFLSAGRHVRQDIPAEVAIKQQQYPDLSIIIHSYLGEAAAIPALLLQLAKTPDSNPG